MEAEWKQNVTAYRPAGGVRYDDDDDDDVDYQKLYLLTTAREPLLSKEKWQ